MDCEGKHMKREYKSIEMEVLHLDTPICSPLSDTEHDNNVGWDGENGESGT